MEGSVRIQEWIHRLEMGAGARYLRWLLMVVAFAAVAALYDSLCFRNFQTTEAMDAAQLGRNIAQGKGFVTSYIRPFSVTLTRESRDDRAAMLNEDHPDISNAPLYPLLLAGVMRLVPESDDLAAIKGFSVVPNDLYIGFFNQILMGLAAFWVFKLALNWFNRSVAWVCAAVFLLTELYWRLSISGLPAMLLMNLFLLLVNLLARFERKQREQPTGRFWGTLTGLGLVTGLLMLTSYSFGWLLLPVAGFVFLYAPGRRLMSVTPVVLAFLLVVSPWLIRNHSLSGWPLGTATFAVLEETPSFPADTLERSLAPAFKGLPGHKWMLTAGVLRKAVLNGRETFLNELPRMGGNWLWSFFLVGLLIRFQNSNLSRLRWFTLWSIGLLAVVQCFVRTRFAADSPVVNSENLLLILSPLVLVFGVGLFFTLLEGIDLPSRVQRFSMISAFVGILCLPMLLVFLPPRPQPFAAPYYPPRLQQISAFVRPDEIWMSDIPWAIAWYGERQAVGMTLNWRKDFFEISDFHKRINGLFVSGRTTDARFLSSWFVGENVGWGNLLLQAFVRRELPDGFPLRESPEGLFTNGELLLMDRPRWLEESWRIPKTKFERK